MPRFSSETPEFARFLGPKGVLEATGTTLRYIPQSGRDSEPSYYANSFPREMHEQYVAEWRAEHHEIWGNEAISEATSYAGPDWDDVRPHLWNFFQAVKSRNPVAEDAIFGNHAAIACHMANESYFRKCPVRWNEAGRSIESSATA